MERIDLPARWQTRVDVGAYVQRTLDAERATVDLSARDQGELTVEVGRDFEGALCALDLRARKRRTPDQQSCTCAKLDLDCGCEDDWVSLLVSIDLPSPQTNRAPRLRNERRAEPEVGNIGGRPGQPESGENDRDERWREPDRPSETRASYFLVFRRDGQVRDVTLGTVGV